MDYFLKEYFNELIYIYIYIYWNKLDIQIEYRNLIYNIFNIYLYIIKLNLKYIYILLYFKYN